MKKFTEEERAYWINFCVTQAQDLGIDHADFNELTDEQLDKEADWYYDLSGK